MRSLKAAALELADEPNTILLALLICEFIQNREREDTEVRQLRKSLEAKLQDEIQRRHFGNTNTDAISMWERARLYCGARSSKVCVTSVDAIDSDEYQVNKLITYRRGKFFGQRTPGGSYRKDMDTFLDVCDWPGEVFVLFGDAVFRTDFAAFVKARALHNPCGILLKLNSAKHWNFPHTALTDPYTWEQKRSRCIFRGAPTGCENPDSYGEPGTLRRAFVKAWAHKYDVGFSHLGRHGTAGDDEWVKGSVSLTEQLENKYIVSLEGNDVATNLKWIMLSNSIPLMPHPTYESWLLESHLIPYVHYVPLDKKGDDLEEKLDWCASNDEHCKMISHNGKKYMNMFFNHESEHEIMRSVFKFYLSCYGRSQEIGM